MKPYTTRECARALIHEERANAAKYYHRGNLDEAVGDLIAKGCPEPQTKKDWAKLRRQVRGILRRSGR